MTAAAPTIELDRLREALREASDALRQAAEVTGFNCPRARILVGEALAQIEGQPSKRVVVSVEDAGRYLNWWEEYEGVAEEYGHTLSDEEYRTADRLRIAIGEECEE